MFVARKLVTLAVSIVVVLLLTPVGSAHSPGSPFRSHGTATSGTLVFDAELLWLGMDAVTDCAGGGCRGTGDGDLILFSQETGAEVLRYRFIGLLDGRFITFTETPDCVAFEVAPGFRLDAPGLFVAGVFQGCSLGVPTCTPNDLNGRFGVFDLHFVDVCWLIT